MTIQIPLCEHIDPKLAFTAIVAGLKLLKNIETMTDKDQSAKIKMEAGCVLENLKKNYPDDYAAAVVEFEGVCSE